MSYQFGNNCYGGPPAPQQGLSGYGQSYNTGQQNYRGQQTPYNNSSSYGYGGGSANYQQNPNNGYTSSTSQYKGIYGGQQQQVNQEYSNPNHKLTPKFTMVGFKCFSDELPERPVHSSGVRHVSWDTAGPKCESYQAKLG